MRISDWSSDVCSSDLGVANPRGLHAERLGVDIHITLADGAPVRNLTEAVQNAHLDVEAVVAAPLAAGYACLTDEERDLGRSEERRVGKECVSTCTYRLSPSP